MKTPEQRINILVGQLESLKSKLSCKNPDCTSSIIQLKAVKAGVSSLMEELVSGEFENCLKNGRHDKIKKIFKEIIK